MIINDDGVYREVQGLNPNDKEAILNFLQGAVYAWCAYCGEDKELQAYKIIGGTNKNWEETPLEELCANRVASNDPFG